MHTIAARFVAVISLVAALQLQAADNSWTELLKPNDFSQNWETTGNWSIKDGVAKLTPRPREKGWERWGMYLWLRSGE